MLAREATESEVNALKEWAAPLRISDPSPHETLQDRKL